MNTRKLIGRAVYIRWQDSHGSSPERANLDGSVQPSVTICHSWGRLVAANKKALLLVPHIAENTILGINQGCGDITIPTCSILKVKVLPC